jgi:hypothetical protein
LVGPQEGQKGESMADIIGFPSEELTPEERVQVEEFVREQVADFQDTSCSSIEEIKEEVAVLLGYFRRFENVVEDPKTKINPDFDFGLFLLEGKIKKIRGMIKGLFENG